MKARQVIEMEVNLVAQQKPEAVVNLARELMKLGWRWSKHNEHDRPEVYLFKGDKAQEGQVMLCLDPGIVKRGRPISLDVTARGLKDFSSGYSVDDMELGQTAYELDPADFNAVEVAAELNVKFTDAAESIEDLSDDAEKE